MADFQNNVTTLTTATPDLFKHVRYSYGMVLGVDDFDQEFVYLSNRVQWLARDVIGYGTICGLKVTTETDARGPRVVVAPGIALSPRGQLIRVTPAQCAYLNDWLTAHSADVIQRTSSPPTGTLPLYVVLCYRDCPTDDVPIPGEPCRTESESTVASRLKDDFQLELSLDPPLQTEEDALRDFVDWLRLIDVSPSGSSTPMDVFLEALRNATYLLQSPPLSPSSPPDFMYGSPPSMLHIQSADVPRYMRAAFRLWVTELRPLWRGWTCEGMPSVADCVLLAQLDIPLDNGQVSSSGTVTINEERRPILVHLRMQQEGMLALLGQHIV